MTEKEKNKVSSYKCDVSDLELIAKDKVQLTIPSERINSIVIEHNYEKHIMPVIYMIISVDADQYKKLFKYKETGKIFLRIKKIDANESNVVGIDKIKDQFVYFLSNNDLEFLKDLEDQNEVNTNSVVQMTIGLMDEKLLNYNKQLFNGIYSDVYMSDMLRTLTSGRETYANKLESDTHYNQIIIPALGTRKDVIDYLFRKDPFYESKYRYFTDFDRNYLYNQNGDGIKVKKKTYREVYINILPVTSDKVLEDGVINNTKKKCYVVRIREDDKSSVSNTPLKYIANHIVAVSDTGVVDEDIIKTKSKQKNTMVVRAGKTSAKVIESNLRSDLKPVNVSKLNADADIFTPDKKFIITIQHRGIKAKGFLTNKKEIIMRKDNRFTTSTTLTLKYVETN